jgi:hypothetical protein
MGVLQMAILTEEPILDLSKTHRVELVDVFKYEDEEELAIYLMFVTCDQPKPVYIYSSYIPDSTSSDIYSDLIELKYIIGCRFDLNVRATEINGITKYYADNIRLKIFGAKDDLVA